MQIWSKPNKRSFDFKVPESRKIRMMARTNAQQNNTAADSGISTPTSSASAAINNGNGGVGDMKITVSSVTPALAVKTNIILLFVFCFFVL